MRRPALAFPVLVAAALLSPAGPAAVRPAATALAADPAVEVGAEAPDFTLKTIGLKDVSLKSFRGKNVVLLFYPLDWTPG